MVSITRHNGHGVGTKNMSKKFAFFLNDSLIARAQKRARVVSQTVFTTYRHFNVYIYSFIANKRTYTAIRIFRYEIVLKFSRTRSVFLTFTTCNFDPSLPLFPFLSLCMYVYICIYRTL